MFYRYYTLVSISLRCPNNSETDALELLGHLILACSTIQFTGMQTDAIGLKI